MRNSPQGGLILLKASPVQGEVACRRQVGGVVVTIIKQTIPTRFAGAPFTQGGLISLEASPVQGEVARRSRDGRVVPTFTKGKHKNCRLTMSGGKRQITKSHAFFSQGWFATPQEVLQADWQEVWHSPHPPFSALFARSFVSMVLILFIVYVTPLTNNSKGIIQHPFSLCQYIPEKYPYQIGDKTENCSGAFPVSLCKTTPWDAKSSIYSKMS